MRCLIKAYSTHTVCAVVPGDSISGENYVRKRGLRTCQKVGYSTEMHLESFISCHPHPPLHPSTHSANCLDFSRGELSVGAPSLLRAVLIYAVIVRQVTEGIQLMAGRSGGEGGGEGRTDRRALVLVVCSLEGTITQSGSTTLHQRQEREGEREDQLFLAP